MHLKCSSARDIAQFIWEQSVFLLNRLLTYNAFDCKKKKKEEMGTFIHYSWGLTSRHMCTC